MKIHSRLLAWARRSSLFTEALPLSDKNKPTFRPPELPPGVVPASALAMDSALSASYDYANLYGGSQGFIGYPALAQLTQLAEYRMLSEKTAQAMTRKWIKLTSSGTGDKSDLISEIEAEFKRFKIRELFAEAAKLDGFFGRAQLFIDLGEQSGEELAMPLILDKAKIKKGSVRKFKIIEPLYTSPCQYNASNPLADDYYNPSAWYVMGMKVHSSRLLSFVGRPVPDLLKPSYNFGGMSMSQLAQPYVDNWLLARNSVSRLLRNFSTTVLKTNMAATLMGDDTGDDIDQRVEVFGAIRDNSGVMLLDKESEELDQINTPLGTVDKLQAQAQEQLSSVSNTPTAILLGITPAGLNASSDDEIRIFYDHVADMQGTVFADPLTTVLQVVQLNLNGEIDPDIGYEFVALWQPDTKESADVRLSDAQASQLYQEMGVISAGEIRSKLAGDPESGYIGLPEVSEDLTPPDNDADPEE